MLTMKFIFLLSEYWALEGNEISTLDKTTGKIMMQPSTYTVHVVAWLFEHVGNQL